MQCFYSSFFMLNRKCRFFPNMFLILFFSRFFAFNRKHLHEMFFGNFISDYLCDHLSETVNTEWSFNTDCFSCTVFFLSPDRVSICVCPHPELHCFGSMVRDLSPFDVQEHSQAGQEQHCHHLDRLLHHNDPAGHRYGVQHHAPWLSQ